MKKQIILLVFVVGSLTVLAQSPKPAIKRIIRSATSPNGNYIYLCGYDHFLNQDSALIGTTDYFLVERLLIPQNQDSLTNTNYKKVGIAKAIQNINELKEHYTDEYIENFKNVFKLKNNNQVVAYFNKHYKPKDFFLFYQTIETKMALGQVYLDKDVKPGEVYQYIVTRVDKNKKQEVWGYCVVESKVGNYTLPYLRAAIHSTFSYDSSVIVNWKLPVGDKVMTQIPIPKSGIDGNQQSVSRMLPFSEKWLRAKVIEHNGDGNFKVVKRLFPTLNATEDTLTYTYLKNCQPEEITVAYLKMEDEVYNEGVESDTVFSFSLEQKSLPIISAVKAVDVENAVQLSWNKLPQKNYITGIAITRYNSQDVLDSIAILSSGDTSFIDDKIELGQHYRYQVKALYLPQIKLQQQNAAEAIGTYTKFSKTAIPVNVTAKNEGKNIRLNWDFNESTGFNGFYVYRGTSPNNLNVIDGPFTQRTYLDTATHLSGRSEYYYAIISQNLRQDTSEYSNIVKISPQRKIETSLTNDISFYYSNGSLNISWKDAMQTDNAIEGFVVQKRTEGNNNFINLNSQPVTSNNISDTNIVAGVHYDYRIATVNFKNEQSDFGSEQTFYLEKNAVDIVNNFYVRNITGAVEISLPNMQFDDRKAYNIYRRDAANLNFSKLSTIAANTFVYKDVTAKSKQVYVYAITITNNDEREGERGKSISIRKD